MNVEEGTWGRSEEKMLSDHPGDVGLARDSSQVHISLGLRGRGKQKLLRIVMRLADLVF